MIGAIVPYINRIRRSYQSNDLIDRISYQYTSLLVAIGAITLAATQYVGKPIQCWVPAQFTGSWEKYAETYCFIKGSYFVPEDERPDDDFIERDKAVIGYYQWVPLMLAFQAFLFYVPCIIWQALNSNTGINVKDVLESVAKVKKNVNASERQEQTRKAAHHIQEALELQRELKTDAGTISKLRKSGHFLAVIYLITKVLYILNIFVQFYIFSIFLNTDNFLWGYTTLNNIIGGTEWESTGFFPRVTMCDFNVRVLGALHRWTVQCVLMINMFTEKIYVFYWFWFIVVGVLATVSFIYWLAALLVPSNRTDFVTTYLQVSGIVNKNSASDERQVEKFVKNSLTGDGVFLIRLIQTNAGDLLTAELVSILYTNYLQRLEKPSILDTDSPDTTATLPR